MLAYKHRFHGHGSLRYVYQHGQNVRGTICSIKHIENKRRKQYRAAVVVSKKVSKSAVRRNRIRRRIYEIIRNHENHINKPHDIVVTVFSDQIVDMEADKLRKVIVGQLTQANVIS